MSCRGSARFSLLRCFTTLDEHQYGFSLNLIFTDGNMFIILWHPSSYKYDKDSTPLMRNRQNRNREELTNSRKSIWGIRQVYWNTSLDLMCRRYMFHDVLVAFAGCTKMFHVWFTKENRLTTKPRYDISPHISTNHRYEFTSVNYRPHTCCIIIASVYFAMLVD